MLTFEIVKKDEEINNYIREADHVLNAMGYTEHAFAHVTKVAFHAGMVLEELGFPDRMAELARIAGYMHDIGNIVNRIDHAQSGALLTFLLLKERGMATEEIAQIVSAVGNHDESTAAPINPVSAALIIADKTDVRRSRVRDAKSVCIDVHDRVNYAVEASSLYFNKDKTAIISDIRIDTNISSVVDYFEIFLERMLLCRKAAEFFKIRFGLVVNGQKLL